LVRGRNLIGPATATDVGGERDESFNWTLRWGDGGRTRENQVRGNLRLLQVITRRIIVAKTKEKIKQGTGRK